MTRSYRRGFTIVELLIVIVVIGILAAITIVAYTGIASRASDATAAQDVNGVVKQLETSKIQNGDTYPSSSNGIKVSAGSTLGYAQLNGGSNYCATILRSDVAYFVTSGFTNKLVGSCPDQTTIPGGKYGLSDPDWTNAQVPALLNGTVATTLAGAPLSVSTALSTGTSTGTHIDANDGNGGGAAGVALRDCYPTPDLDGIPCPANPTPDMQITSGRTLTITANLTDGAYNSFSFLMSDVESNSVTVTAYDTNNAVISSALWQVSSYGRAYDSSTNVYKAVIPSTRPNPYVNNSSGINFSPMTSLNDDAMRTAFDVASAMRLKKIVITFTSASTSDWVQWDFLARHT